MDRCRILIVEDSATQAEALRALLAREFEVVDVASGAEDALVRLEQSAPDLVLSDIVMPGMSGYELAQRVKSDARLAQIPVVLLTSLADPIDIVRGLECGADNYVTKPYDPEYLLARVRHVLGQKRLRRDARASLGVSVNFLGASFTITSDREQILDLFISSVEDVVRTNQALQESQRELAEAQQQLERFARQMAHRAHVSTERYSRLMENASDAIFVVDDSHRIVEANGRASELLGRELEELRSQPLGTLVVAEDEEALAIRVAGDAAATSGGEIRFVTRDGAVVYCEVSASRSNAEDGELHLVILHDVTERRRDEAALRRANQTLRAVIQASPPAIVAIDADDRVTLWNPAAERIFGFRADEVLGQPLPIVPPELAEDFAIRRAKGTAGGVVLEESKRLRKDGSLVDVLLSTAPLHDDDGRVEGVLAVIQDITDRKRAEAALAASEEQLRQAQKMEAIGRLAGGVAHDFNNLITAIRGYTQILLDDVSPDDPSHGDLEEIEKAAIRAAALTGQLLAFSRKQVLQPRVLSVNAVIEGVEKMLRRLLTENIRLEVSLDHDVGMIKADAGQLEQVLMNLAVNAADAMPTGGSLHIETSSLRVEMPRPHPHGLIRAGDYVLLRVRDTGTGMDADTLAHIFEPFFTTKGPGKGTGLGLSTVFGIVQQSGGHVLVQSQPGVGTAFDIYLPRVRGASPDSATTGEHPAALRGTETVLVVEDESAVRTIAMKSLRRHGYTVIEAPDAETALRILEAEGEHVDLILTDAIMPGLGGPELVRRVGTMLPLMPVLLMTGYTDRSLVDLDALSPNVRLINKPFTPTQLLLRIREFLDVDD